MLPFETFCGGAITAGFVIAGFHFLRFWSRTKQGLFKTFAVAFWLLALNQIFSRFLDGEPDTQVWTYFLRLAAFSMIILAIVQKNMEQRRP